jgi:AraC-like DNA-binding protein
MYSFRCDPLERFVRDYQVATAEWLPPTTAKKVVTTALAMLLIAPETVPPGVRAVVCGMVRALGEHVFGSASMFEPHQDNSLTNRVFMLLLATPNSLAWRLSTVADAVGVSRTHLSHSINSVCGAPLILHVRALRILKAATLLTKSRPKTSEIASALGYAHTTGLDREFRIWLHMSPCEFRQSIPGPSNRHRVWMY